ncbi:Matrix-remodeling-associated protein 7 [Caenorhabditis elegans]|uniref:Matrix-remodeling-associated protein 7 n=1 Tax=Caenorhabditis elegans TaxID=6239 RepID=Q564Y2_CAEEL|nr:Matrix-remodeling-associated protein 7 [Caenorhabditis elegans]CAI79142.2 Matrix-remodeling-associated protein 7 [Caenorhabditis elegans]|eukprot:NP_001023689.2 Uncharacterized protein CELE_C30G7.4 [Caenorhabditis elegans]
MAVFDFIIGFGFMLIALFLIFLYLNKDGHISIAIKKILTNSRQKAKDLKDGSTSDPSKTTPAAPACSPVSNEEITIPSDVQSVNNTLSEISLSEAEVQVDEENPNIVKIHVI